MPQTSKIRQMRRRQRRVKKIRKLKVKYIAAKDPKERLRIGEKIHKLHPWVELPEA